MERGGTSKPKALGRGQRSRLARRAAILFSTIRTAAQPTVRRSATAKSASGAVVSFMPKRFGRLIAQTSASAAPRCASAAKKPLLCQKKPKGNFVVLLAFMSMTPQPDRASCKTRDTPWSRFPKEHLAQRSTALAVATGCLSIVTLCSKNLGGNLAQERTCTTSMENAMTTDLKTLSFGKSRSHAAFARPTTTAPAARALRCRAGNASGIFAL